MSAELLVSGPKEHGIGVVGPPRPKPNWQAKTGGAYTAEHFQVDWESRRAICPQGKSSTAWREGQRRNGDPFVVARLDAWWESRRMRRPASHTLLGWPGEMADSIRSFPHGYRRVAGMPA